MTFKSDCKKKICKITVVQRFQCIILCVFIKLLESELEIIIIQLSLIRQLLLKIRNKLKMWKRLIGLIQGEMIKRNGLKTACVLNKYSKIR